MAKFERINTTLEGFRYSNLLRKREFEEKAPPSDRLVGDHVSALRLSPIFFLPLHLCKAAVDK